MKPRLLNRQDGNSLWSSGADSGEHFWCYISDPWHPHRACEYHPIYAVIFGEAFGAYQRIQDYVAAHSPYRAIEVRL